MNFVVKKKPDAILQPQDHDNSRKNSTLGLRNNRRTLFGKRKSPRFTTKRMNERFITAKSNEKVINNNNFVRVKSKDDNDNIKVNEVDCFVVKDLFNDVEASDTCDVEVTVVDHGCDDEVLVVDNPNGRCEVGVGANPGCYQTLEGEEVSQARGHLSKEDNRLLKDQVLNLLERFVQDNTEAHSLLKHDTERNLFGDLDSSLGELMPKARSLDTLEKEVYEGLNIFDRVDEIEAQEHLRGRGNTFHSGNLNHRKSRPKKACGVKVLYDCKACEGVFMTMSELLHHQESVHDKAYSCQVCEKTFRKEAYLEIHRDIHFCSHCGVFEKFKGTICDQCKGKKKRSLLTTKSTKKSLSTPVKSSGANSNIWKKKATTNLGRFLLKSRSYRN